MRVIEVENLTKQYMVGVINHGTLRKDLQSWWARINGRPDPNLPVNFSGRFDPRTWDATKKDGDGSFGASVENRKFLALDNVSFTVDEGEVIGIIGRNGAGKSTLLKILCRITSPTAGRVKIKGRIASLLEVGIGFHPELTGRENVYLNGAILGMKRRDITAKFDEIVSFASLEGFIDTPVKRYSSGMYVRLAFAVAAHLDAEIMIVDEVLAVGDTEFQRKCMQKVSSMTSEGRTILFVSHNLVAVQSLCSRGILLEQGRLVASGDTDEIIRMYLSRHKTRSASKVSLEERKDRQGDGRIRFVSVSFEDEHGGPVMTGCKGRLRIKLRNTTPDILDQVSVAVGIDNELGGRVAFLSSDVVTKPLVVSANSEGEIDFLFDRVPLVEGEYFLTLFGKVDGNVSDWIQGASSFEVHPGDYYGNGFSMPSGQSALYLDYRIRMYPNVDNQ